MSSLLLFGASSGGESVGSFVAADASALTTSVTTLTGVTWPAHNADDVAIVGWASDNTQTRTEPPSGFTSEFTNADGSLRAIVASLDSTGSESGDVSLVCGGANRQAGVIALYRGYNPSITNVTSQNETSGTGVTSHNSPSITPTDSGSAIVLIYMDRVTSSVLPTAPAGYSVRGSFATGGSGGVTVVIADKLTGLTAGVPESPAAWTGATSGTAAYVIALELVPSVSSFTGTAAVTQAADVAAASGQLGYTATATPGQAANTSAASGQLGYSGSSAVTQAAQSSSATGQLGYSGTAARTQASQTASATGNLGYAASGTPVQAADTSSAAGAVINPVVGTSVSVQAGQTAAATGLLSYAGTADANQAGDTSDASGIYFIPTIGTAAALQADQLAAAVGTWTPRTTSRPDLGTTSRAADGVTPRPFTTVTPRP